MGAAWMCGRGAFVWSWGCAGSGCACGSPRSPCKDGDYRAGEQQARLPPGAQHKSSGFQLTLSARQAAQGIMSECARGKKKKKKERNQRGFLKEKNQGAQACPPPARGTQKMQWVQWVEGWARHTHVTHRGFSGCIDSSPGPALTANTGHPCHTGAQCSSLCADPCPWLAWQLLLGNGSEGKINISQLYTCPHKLPGKQLGALCSPTHAVHHPKRQEAAKPLPGWLLGRALFPSSAGGYWYPQAWSLPLWPGRIWAEQSRDSVPTMLPKHSPQYPCGMF